MIREIYPYKHYFWEFYEAQPEKVQEKIDYVLSQVAEQQHIPQKLFKHLEDGIYEVRIQVGNNIYRIFCCFDDGNLVVLFQGIQKKTQKVPRKDIAQAKTIRGAYYEDKTTNNL